MFISCFNNKKVLVNDDFSNFSAMKKQDVKVIKVFVIVKIIAFCKRFI